MSQNSTCTYFLGCLICGFLRDYLNAGDSLASDEYESFFPKTAWFCGLDDSVNSRIGGSGLTVVSGGSGVDRGGGGEVAGEALVVVEV